VKPGNAMPLASMPVGTIVHNVEMKPGKGGQIARSAGAYAQLVGRDQGMAILRLNSGEQRLVSGRCMATVGAVSNPDHGNINDGKAGRSRWPASARCPRCCDEPGRSPAWWWRRPHIRRPSSGHPMGQADQGQADPFEQVDRQVHHALAPPAQEVREGLSRHGSFSLERPVR
jgi:hypothetical protein